MEVKINECYIQEIEELKEITIKDKDNYELKSRYFYIALYALAILYDLVLLPDTINKVTGIVYAIPLIIGTFIEFREMKKYDVLDLGLIKLEKLLYIITIRIMNMNLFIMTVILMLGQGFMTRILYGSNYSFGIDAIFIGLFLILLVLSILAFFIGIKRGKKQVGVSKRKKAISTALMSTFITIGIVLFRKIPYIYIVIFAIFVVVIISYGIGKLYFRYKNFDKKINENDIMTDYKL